VAIASNHPGPDRIAFDATVFPAGAPATIQLERTLAIEVAETELDGTDRGVVLGGAAGFTGTLLETSGAVTLRAFGLATAGAPRIIVDGSGAKLIELELAGGANAIELQNATDVLVSSVVIGAGDGNGITITGGARIAIEDSKYPVLATQSDNITIQRCTIVISDKTLGRGIRFEGVAQSHILDNLIDPGPAQLISFQDSSNNEIIGNILDGGNVGIALFGTSSANLIFRNVIMGSSDEAMAIESEALANRVFNTTIFNAPGISDAAPDTQIANTLEVATGFVDPGTYDFRLLAGNAAIDMGTDIGLDMLPSSPDRFLGDAPDLGAVESF
jgi:parallel beta-helix repeat protein